MPLIIISGLPSSGKNLTSSIITARQSFHSFGFSQVNQRERSNSKNFSTIKERQRKSSPKMFRFRRLVSKKTNTLPIHRRRKLFELTWNRKPFAYWIRKTLSFWMPAITLKDIDTNSIVLRNRRERHNVQYFVVYRRRMPGSSTAIAQRPNRIWVKLLEWTDWITVMWCTHKKYSMLYACDSRNHMEIGEWF